MQNAIVFALLAILGGTQCSRITSNLIVPDEAPQADLLQCPADPNRLVPSRAEFVGKTDLELKAILNDGTNDRNSLKFRYPSVEEADSEATAVLGASTELFNLMSHKHKSGPISWMAKQLERFRGKESGSIPADKVALLGAQAKRRSILDFFERNKNAEMQDITPNSYLPILIYTDFEPDDILAIAALWKKAADARGQSLLEAKPIIVYMTQFADKDDKEKAVEFKVMNAHAVLGLVPFKDYQIVTPDDASQVPKASLVNHKAFIASQTPSAMTMVADLAVQAGASTYYVLAPGWGLQSMLHASFAARALQSGGQPHTFSTIMFYSGGVNVRENLQSDWDAIQAFASGKVYDVSRVPFFCYEEYGGKESRMPFQHKDLNAFLPESFAADLMARVPKAVAVSLGYRVYFTSSRISPRKPATEFYKRPKHVTKEQEAAFFEQIEAQREELGKLWTTHGADVVSEGGLEQYAFGVWKSCIYNYLVPFRQKVVARLAQGSDSVPITDLLAFVFEYYQSDSTVFKQESEVSGRWYRLANVKDRSIGFLNGAMFTEKTEGPYERQVLATGVPFDTYKVDTGLEATPAILKYSVCQDREQLDNLGRHASNYIMAFLDERLGRSTD